MAAGIFADGCGRSDEKTVGVKNRKRLSGALAFWKFDELPPHTRDFSRELGDFTCTIKVRMV